MECFVPEVCTGNQDFCYYSDKGGGGALKRSRKGVVLKAPLNFRTPLTCLQYQDTAVLALPVLKIQAFWKNLASACQHLHPLIQHLLSIFGAPRRKVSSHIYLLVQSGGCFFSTNEETGLGS